MKNAKVFPLLAVALCFTASSAVFAADMTKVEYKSAKERIAGDYKASKTTCGALSGNAKDVCIAEAKAAEKIGSADLEVQFRPTVRNRYDLQVTKAKANYAVAKERCDDMAGNTKDVCVKEAQSIEAAEMADAKLRMKTVDANATARNKTVTAYGDADETARQARSEANEEKRDASYAVSVEKCEAYAGAAKEKCVDQAKVRFEK